jgi:hypothetical protein
MNKITKYIRNRLKIWDRKGFSPRAINCGDCCMFAVELQKRFPRGKVAWGEEVGKHFKTHVDQVGHCFFKYGKKFYDSESPDGVDCPDRLMYYVRQLKD